MPRHIDRLGLTLRLPLALIALGLIYMGIFSKRGWLDYHRISRQKALLEARIEVTEKKRQQLAEQVLALKSNSREQERMVREVLGYVRPNETIIEFP